MTERVYNIPWERTGPFRVPKPTERVLVMETTVYPGFGASTTTRSTYGRVKRIYRHIRKACVQTPDGYRLVDLPGVMEGD